MGKSFSGLSEKLSFSPRFLVKNAKICRRKNGFTFNLSSVGLVDFKKHQTLEVFTNVEFLHIFKKNITFLRFLKFINRLCKSCCMHFILSEQDRSNRIELNLSIL